MRSDEAQRRTMTMQQDEGDARFGALLELITRSGRESGRQVIRAPYTGDVIVELPLCDEADVEGAMDAARPAQARWAAETLGERIRILQRFGDLVWKRRADLLDLMQLETGKTRRDAFEEVADVLLNAIHYGNAAPALLGPVRRRGAMPGLATTRVHHHPVGIVGVIAPWNYPLTLAISDALPALMAGNAVILKPAEQTSLTALYVRLLLIEAGLPPDVFHVITGSGETLGTPLIDGIDFLQFTGSTAVGRVVAARAAQRLIGTSLELGGKNAIILLDDAPRAEAIDGIIKGCFTNAGQLCISFERLYIQRGLYREILPELIRRVESMRVGAGRGYDVDMGSIVSPRQLERIEAHVSDAVEKGATVLTGANRLPQHGPLFYAPTLLEGVSPESRAFHEETFGPVVAVYPFDDVDDVVRMANDSEYGLNGSVWSRDVRKARRIALRLECGSVSINDAYGSTWGAHGAPIGGRKSSGIGRRHGEEGILKFTESQTITTQRLHPVAVSKRIPGHAFVNAVSAYVRLKRRLPLL